VDWLQALLLGILQGIAEFLPISSDGHLELGKSLLKVEGADNLLFTVVVHGATVLSTLIIFWSEIRRLLTGTLKFRWNDETQYVVKIIVSMIPVAIVGVFMKDWVESFFNGDIAFVGAMLLLTAAFLLVGHFMGRRKEGKPVSYVTAFIIGIAQAIAVMPGLSRSGTTIATGLMLGVDKKKLAEFSFLMVIVPIIGANALELLDMRSAANSDGASITAGVGALQLVIGFIAAFITGLFACKWMINMVKKGNLLWFAVYCIIIGLVAIGVGLN
jgi:undecaprenyl-diphosphatase